VPRRSLVFFPGRKKVTYTLIRAIYHKDKIIHFSERNVLCGSVPVV
jgi:hypothetical protein